MDIAGGGKLIGKKIAGCGNDYRNTGMQVSLCVGGLTHGDTGNIGDGIPGTGRHGARQKAKITDAHISIPFLPHG